MTAKDLIPVHAGTIGDEEIQTVNARELHVFLEVGRDFATWIKERIDEYGFVEGQDFVKTSMISRSPKSGNAKSLNNPNPPIDYHLSLDMAKELAMVERNDKGRQARRYFIACEKKLQEVRLGAGTAALARVEGLEQKMLALGEANQSALDGIRILTNTVKRLETLAHADFPMRVFPFSDTKVHVFLVRERPVILARDFLRAIGHTTYSGEQAKLKSLHFVRDDEYLVERLAVLASNYGVSSGFICGRTGLGDPKYLSFVTQPGVARIKDKHPALYHWWKETVLPALPQLFAVIPDKPVWEVRS